MLTKKEREEIAERFRNYNGEIHSIYEYLTGKTAPSNLTVSQGFKEVSDRLIDICDTSNMLELPVDKDGEYIRVGDVVYGEDNLRLEVSQIVFEDDIKWLVLVSNGRLCVGTYSNPTAFTHKEPVTIYSLIKRIKDALDNVSDTTLLPYAKLSRIADELESLGDGNE